MEKHELVMLWCSVYLYYTVLKSKAWTQVLHFANVYWFMKKYLKRLICLGYWRTKQWKCLAWEKEAKTNLNSVEQKPEEIRKFFINPKFDNEDFA